MFLFGYEFVCVHLCASMCVCLCVSVCLARPASTSVPRCTNERNTGTVLSTSTNKDEGNKNMSSQF